MGGFDTGSKWTELLKAVRGFFGRLATNQRGSKVTVIGYDDIDKVLFQEQAPSEALADQIDWTGFGTNFDKPLTTAYGIATST